MDKKLIEKHELLLLAIDDNAVILRGLTKALEKEGYRVLNAFSGPAGRKLAIMAQPDLILLDVMMPEEDGFETLSKLKADSATSKIPVIFLTGLEELKSKVEGFELGAVDYIVKPCDLVEVRLRIGLHLKLSLAQKVLVESQAQKLKQISEAQSSLLVQPEDFPEANFGVYYHSLHEAGGDFYDCIRISEHIFGYFVADISGHDLGTSFITSSVKALFQQNTAPCYQPLETMEMINGVLKEILPQGKFLTAIYATLNTASKTLTIVNAGHPPLLYIPRGEKSELVEMSGDILGVYGKVTFEKKEIKVSSGDRFFLYSDGLVEKDTTNVEKLWSTASEDLLEVCNAMPEMPVLETPKQLKELMCPPDEVVSDDIVVLTVEVP